MCVCVSACDAKIYGSKTCNPSTEERNRRIKVQGHASNMVSSMSASDTLHTLTQKYLLKDKIHEITVKILPFKHVHIEHETVDSVR